MLSTFDRRESEVRGYVRSFPTVFTKAKGAELWDERGQRFLDLFAGAGALSYGHNNETLRAPLIEYLMSDGPTHALDMATSAKRDLLETIETVLLEPRGLDYKVQFPGPTGTNAVEAALKLARKVTGRTQVASFTNGFHGMTLGALAVTGNASKRAGAGVPLSNATALPFDGYHGSVDTLGLIERVLGDTSSGLEKPAAFLLETVQGEGGVRVASERWLRGLAEICDAHDILLIVDDIQVGCGRTGSFFSFERAGIEPDIICLSKSLSGYGLPFSLVLLRPELDVWNPGEHNGTFRGFNPAMVTAKAALETYWQDERLTDSVRAKGALVDGALRRIASGFAGATVRGLGLIQGVELPGDAASRISAVAFERGVLIETAGPSDEVLKVLPPLVIPEAQLREALDVLIDAAEGISARPTTDAPLFHD